MDIVTTSEVEAFDGHHHRSIPLRHSTRYALGVDVGQAHDPTALAVVARVTTEVTWPGAEHLNPHPKPRYEVRHLERLPLGKPYPSQVDYVASLLQRDPLARLRPTITVDYTGVGRPVLDMFRERTALRMAQGVVITGGREVAPIDAGWSVPKVELVSRLQALLHAGLLKVPRALPDAGVLVRELQDFRVSFTDAGNAVFNAREGAHDDLVLALAMAVFALSRPQPARNIKLVMPH